MRVRVYHQEQAGAQKPCILTTERGGGTQDFAGPGVWFLNAALSITSALIQKEKPS